MINTKTISEQLYETLRSQIINNKITPGSKIDFDTLLKDYNISKTPVKTALAKLEYDGLVTIKPRSGTYVSIPSIKQIIDTYELREAIEWKAIQLAIPNIPKEEILKLKEKIDEAEDNIFKNEFKLFFESDVDLHELICNYSNNDQLIKVKNMIDYQTHWFRVLGATGQNRAYKSSIRHKEILNTMLNKNIKKSADILSLHIDEVKEAVIEDIKSNYIEINNH